VITTITHTPKSYHFGVISPQSYITPVLYHPQSYITQSDITTVLHHSSPILSHIMSVFYHPSHSYIHRSPQYYLNRAVSPHSYITPSPISPQSVIYPPITPVLSQSSHITSVPYHHNPVSSAITQVIHYLSPAVPSTRSTSTPSPSSPQYPSPTLSQCPSTPKPQYPSPTLPQCPSPSSPQVLHYPSPSSPQYPSPSSLSSPVLRYPSTLSSVYLVITDSLQESYINHPTNRRFVFFTVWCWLLQLAYFCTVVCACVCTFVCMHLYVPVYVCECMCVRAGVCVRMCLSFWVRGSVYAGVCGGGRGRWYVCICVRL
jgi:hypothetical protein